ncbi:MAG: hypothetical protein EXR62_02590 [Chloroflexi bacterium]|nr:hypothetical protein [Chloroflexota bacterium]
MARILEDWHTWAAILKDYHIIMQWNFLSALGISLVFTILLLGAAGLMAYFALGLLLRCRYRSLVEILVGLALVAFVGVEVWVVVLGVPQIWVGPARIYLDLQRPGPAEYTGVVSNNNYRPLGTTLGSKYQVLVEGYPQALYLDEQEAKALHVGARVTITYAPESQMILSVKQMPSERVP